MGVGRNAMRRIGNPDIDQRTILKTIGASGVGISGLSIGASAEGKLLRGIYYDTLTHKVGGEVSGFVESSDSGLDGQVNVAGFSLPLSKLEKNHGTAQDTYYGRFTESKFKMAINRSKFSSSRTVVRLRITQGPSHGHQGNSGDLDFISLPIRGTTLKKRQKKRPLIHDG